jgi:hypothetical protein
MEVPAPTPFTVSKYSTDSAGSFFGTPIIELLHDYHHEGSDDVSDPEYLVSAVGFFASIIVIGFLFLCVLWCFNCFACCECCRNALKCCFGVFHERKLVGKLTVIFIFLIASITATTSYVGRNEFNDAVFEIGDQLRYTGNLFNKLENTSSEIITQSLIYSRAVSTLNCANQSATEAFTSSTEAMENVGDALYDLVDGIGGDLKGYARDLEETFPPYVDMSMITMTCLIWFNAILGSFAIMTDCKCDDCLVIFIGTITILILTIAVGLEMMIATTTADFCYATPENVLLDLAGSNQIAQFYLTCSGTSPFASHFDDARSSVVDFRTTIEDNGQWCLKSSVNTISATTNMTIASITDMEVTTGCSSINPLFTNTVHGIVCDELVRGLFITFMVQAFSAIILFIALMIFPCAANTKVRFKDPKHMVKRLSEQLDKASSSNKVAPSPEPPSDEKVQEVEANSKLKEGSVSSEEEDAKIADAVAF